MKNITLRSRRRLCDGFEAVKRAYSSFPDLHTNSE